MNNIEIWNPGGLPEGWTVKIKMAAKPDFIRIRKYDDNLIDYEVSFGKSRERPAYYKVTNRIRKI